MVPDCVMNSTKLMKHEVFMEVPLGQGQQGGWGGGRVTRSPGVIQVFMLYAKNGSHAPHGRHTV